MRFRVHIPASSLPAASGSQIFVYRAGTTSAIPDTLYSDATSTSTLAQGYSHAGGDIVFYRASPESVSVGVRSPGSSVTAVSPLAHSAEKVRSYSLWKQGGRAIDWVVG